MQSELICKQTFIYFYEKIYHTHCPAETFNSPKALLAISGFVQRIEKEYGKSVGAEYIWNYIWYQFSRYVEKIEDNNVGVQGKMTPLIIFGKKPHEVFKSRRVDMDWISEKSPLKVKYQITKAELTYIKGVKFTAEPEFKESPYNKDPIKRIASLGDNALATCEDMTDLYNHKDKSCGRCIDAVKCKLRLKELYPKVYKARNYE